MRKLGIICLLGLILVVYSCKAVNMEPSHHVVRMVEKRSYLKHDEVNGLHHGSTTGNLRSN